MSRAFNTGWTTVRKIRDDELCPSCKENPGSFDYWGGGPYECFWCATGRR